MSFSGKNKTGITILLAVLTLVLFHNPAFGAGGHGTSPQLIEFRINNAAVQFGIDPPTFQKGAGPKAFVSLKDAMSGSPVYDAELFIYFEKEIAEVQKSPETGLSSTNNNESEDLDFGDFGSIESGENAMDLSLFKQMERQKVAGMYSVLYPLTEEGTYRFTIAVKSLQGQKFERPLMYGSTISYKSTSKIPFYRMLFIIGIILSSGIAGTWIMAQRKRLKLETSGKLNLLDIPWVNRFFKSSWFQPVFQIPTLIVFLIIIIAGLFDIQEGDKNIATLLTWTIWWAAIIFTFVFVGRIWCMACPIGALQDWIVRLKSFNRNFPKSLRNIYLSSLLFFGLTWWDSYSGIVNRPALTAYLLIGFFVAAGGMALIYKGRSFCRYVCPIGGLIGLYSMFSPVELRNRCLEVCRNHKEKECIKGTAASYPCPMFVTPMTLDRNNYCNICSECIKSCSQNNIVLRVRSFAKDIWLSSKGYLDEAFLAIGLIGMTIIVTGEMVEPWHTWMDTAGSIIPFDSLGIADHSMREKLTFLVVITAGSLILPALLLFLTSLIVRKYTGPESPLSLKRTFIQFAYMFIPIGLSTHLSHNVNHLLLEGPGIVPAFQRLANELTGSMSSIDWTVTPLMGLESIFWLQMLIIVILNIFSLYSGYRIAAKFYGDKSVRAFIPMAILATSFMVMNAYILGQPMAMRHAH
jgi:polyferredoxin